MGGAGSSTMVAGGSAGRLRALVPSASAEARLLESFARTDFAEVKRRARSMVRSYPRHMLGWKVLAATLIHEQQWAEAFGIYERIAAECAGDWQFRNNYGNALKTVGRQAEAEREYRAAMALAPRQLEPVYNLGLTLMEMGRPKAAEEMLKATLRLAPDHGLAHLNLANLFNVQARLEESARHYEQALRTIPNDARLWNNFGQLRNKQRRFAEAEGAFRRSLEVEPGYATAWSNLAELMAGHGLVAEAEGLLRHGLELEPSHALAHSNLLFLMAHREGIEAEAWVEEHRAFQRRFEEPLRGSWQPHGNVREPDRRLRIGFVSGDLRCHPVVRYLRPTLERLRRREDLELVAFHNSAIEDAETGAYRALFAAWWQVEHMNDEALAERIRAERIDVLIDLSGHTGHNRLLAFARKPAPVQVSWMGYVGSTGLESMDYAVTDRVLIPETMRWQYTERLIRLPVTTSFEPVVNAPEVTPLPALLAGVFTFACLARANKLNRTTVGAWAEILRRTEETRLMLMTLSDGRPPQAVQQWLVEAGVDGSMQKQRILWAHPRNVPETLDLHRLIDLCLDTFPYNGSTSSSHSLWMGVPTLTLSGGLPSSRMGAALNKYVGVEGFTAATVTAYVERAVAWSRNRSTLSELRSALRGKFAASRLQQHDMVADALTMGIREAWRRWCRNLEPTDIFLAGESDCDATVVQGDGQVR